MDLYRSLTVDFLFRIGVESDLSRFSTNTVSLDWAPIEPSREQRIHCWNYVRDFQRSWIVHRRASRFGLGCFLDFSPSKRKNTHWYRHWLWWWCNPRYPCRKSPNQKRYSIFLRICLNLIFVRTLQDSEIIFIHLLPQIYTRINFCIKKSFGVSGPC